MGDILPIWDYLVLYIIALRKVIRFYEFPAPSSIGSFLNSRLGKMMRLSYGIIKGSEIDVARAVEKDGKVYVTDIQKKTKKLEKSD